MSGVTEQVAVRIVVYSRRHGTQYFGLSSQGFSGGEVPRSGDGADITMVGWGRSLAKNQDGSQAGQMAFALPGRRFGLTGHPWSERISPNDTVELQLKVERTDPAASRDWWTEFVGEVRSVTRSNDDTLVTCQDAMGRLAYEHFSYWRNLGDAVGSGAQEDAESRLGPLGGSQLLTNNSIAGSAEAIFKALLYTRLSTRIKLGNEEVKWDALHAYRFESDDLNITTDLQSLAPEGTSWGSAVSWAVDSPEFYEFFMDNVPEAELATRLANGGQSGAGFSNAQQLKSKPGRVFSGKRIERFAIRPAPFPVYDPEKGGYRSAAWDKLPTTVAWPWGVIKSEVSRSRDDLYSTYSVDLVNGGTNNANNSENASAQAQLIIDGEQYAFGTGYRPLDARSKRIATSGAQDATSATPVQLSRTLAWQLCSFHHFNDRFYSGTIQSSFDERPRLGERYIAEGYLYYLEGYQHLIEAGGAAQSSLSVTRGLTLPQYGIRMRGEAVHMLGRAAEEPEWQAEWRLFPDHLGRQKPGDTYPPKLQDVTDPRFLDEIGKHEGFTP